MGHKLIIGMTESGKSRLGITFCREFKKKRIPTVVLDPMFDERWEAAADIVFRNIDNYMKFLWTHKGYFAFIDESGGFGKYNTAIEGMICKGRHLGHNLILMTQKVTQVSTLIREQCREFYLFAANDRAIDEISSECRKPQLLTAPELKPGEFYKVSRFSEISKYSIDFATGTIYRLEDVRCNAKPDFSNEVTNVPNHRQRRP